MIGAIVKSIMLQTADFYFKHHAQLSALSIRSAGSKYSIEMLNALALFRSFTEDSLEEMKV
jgi:hypothetical protein